MFKKFTTLAAIALMGLMVLPSAAKATLTLKVFDSNETVIVTDDGLGDNVNPNPAGLNFISAVIVLSDGTAITVDTGQQLLFETQPSMDLNIVMTTTLSEDADGVPNSGNLVTFELSQTGFSLTDLMALSFAFGGTSDGSLTSELFIDITNTNTLTGTAVSLGLLSGGGNPFPDGSLTGIVSGTDIYSVFIVTTIDHTGITGVSSVDTRLQVPEPGTLAILGMGLLGLGLTGRRRRMAA